MRISDWSSDVCSSDLIRDPDQVVQLRGEFLEGIDIAWEESFEDWLREERQAIAAAREAAETGALPVGPRDDQTSSSGRPNIGIVVHQQELPAQQMGQVGRAACREGRGQEV